LDPPPHHIAISQYFKMPLKCHRLPVLGTRNGSLTFPLHLSEPHSQTETAAPNAGGSSSKRFGSPLTLHIYLFKPYNELGNRDSIDIMSRLHARRFGVWTQQVKENFLFSNNVHTGSGSPTSSYLNGYWCLYSLNKTVWSVRLTSHSI